MKIILILFLSLAVLAGLWLMIHLYLYVVLKQAFGITDASEAKRQPSGSFSAVVKQVVPYEKVVIRFCNSHSKKTITEINVPRPLVLAAGISAPAGFIERPLEQTDRSQDSFDEMSERDQESMRIFVENFNRERVRWTGRFSIKPGQFCDLTFPAKSVQKVSGKMQINYEVALFLGFACVRNSLSINLSLPLSDLD